MIEVMGTMRVKIAVIERQLDYDKDAHYGVGDNAVADNYKRLKEAFTTHFSPRRNYVYTSHVFHTMRQEEGESMTTFSVRLKEQAKVRLLQ